MRMPFIVLGKLSNNSKKFFLSVRVVTNLRDVLVQAKKLTFQTTLRDLTFLFSF